MAKEPPSDKVDILIDRAYLNGFHSGYIANSNGMSGIEFSRAVENRLDLIRQAKNNQTQGVLEMAKKFVEREYTSVDELVVGVTYKYRVQDVIYIGPSPYSERCAVFSDPHTARYCGIPINCITGEYLEPKTQEFWVSVYTLQGGGLWANGCYGTKDEAIECSTNIFPIVGRNKITLRAEFDDE
jgi:hypothetical protein